ncbi:MAG: hypothetical protein RLN76_11605 [Phycisphaeraceae bacterium]
MRIAHPTRLLLPAALIATLVPLTAHAAINDINSVVFQERIFNDYQVSTLNVTDNDLTEFVIFETDFIPDDVGGSFTNRHAAWLSTDDSTPYAFQTDEAFDLSIDIKLEIGSLNPTKEVGIYMETFVGGQGQFIIKPNGEIAAFGQFPFVSSTALDGDGPEFGGRTYVTGETINLRIIYTPGDGPGGSIPATMEYLVDGVSSGPRDFGNLENGIIPNSNLGTYAQFPPNLAAFPADFGRGTFTNWQLTGDAPGVPGDFNADTLVNADDIDLLTAAIRAGSTDTLFDVDGSTTVDAGDLDELVGVLVGTFFGDANLDFEVDLIDLSALASNFGNTAGWAGGNFNTDTVVDLIDLSLLASSFGSSAAIPEPAGLTLLALASVAATRRRA